MKYELLIKEKFWKNLYNSLDKSKKRVYMQFMTFEGDRTGLKLANKLIELKKRGVDVKILIDKFTDYYVSDTYYKKNEVKEEVISTKKMIEDMRAVGIKIKRTRPYGPGNVFFLARNHKKIIIIDDKYYLGGINISDHNKEWYDFMVKIKDEKSLNYVVKDFKSTFSGKEINYSNKPIFTNRYIGEKYYDLINNAKKEIIISSPYIIDLSLINLLRDKKISKILLTLKDNNQQVINNMSKYVYGHLIKDGTKIFHYSSFSHAKFLIIDRKKLLIGSSNFGKESFTTKQEIGILIEDKKFINKFIKKLYLNEKKNLNNYKCPKRKFFKQLLYTHLVYYLLLIYFKFFVGRVKPLEKK